MTGAGGRSFVSVPSWSNQEICWKCQACRDESSPMCYKNGQASAGWRRARLDARAFFQRQRGHGITPSPLFSCPGFLLSFIMIDVLHSMDFGITQDCLGHLFYDVLDTLCTGRTRVDQVKCL